MVCVEFVHNVFGGNSGDEVLDNMAGLTVDREKRCNVKEDDRCILYIDE